jgi:hypothetical protein
VCPTATELDLWSGACFVSIVGFRFVDTRVLGLAIPFHRNFEEVNLRFYVRRVAAGEVRRGVVFLKEIVPRRAIAWLANTLYHEKYVALPMSHLDATTHSPPALAYSLRHDGSWCRLGMTLEGKPLLPGDGSEEAFITEHYWGYTARPDGSNARVPGGASALARLEGRGAGAGVRCGGALRTRTGRVPRRSAELVLRRGRIRCRGTARPAAAALRISMKQTHSRPESRAPLLAGCTQAPKYDVVIRHGTVYDGNRRAGERPVTSPSSTIASPRSVI